MTKAQPNSIEHLTPHAAGQLLPSGTRLGTVHLDVTDGQNSRIFWTQYVGLKVISESAEAIELGADSEVLVTLHPGASGPVVPRHTGLYHVALHLPAQIDLARVVARLAALKWQQSPTDHTETMATYLSDPDGNGIEITLETPERGHLVRDQNSYAAMLADGTVRSGTEPLDVEDLLSVLTEEDDLAEPLPEGSRVGHVHLHVNDLPATRAFYVDAIGLGDMRAFDRIGMTDFSLDTSFVPHALAANIWNGRGSASKPNGTAGLRSWQLIVPTDRDLADLSRRLSDAGFPHQVEGGRLAVDDPAGNPLRVHVG